MNSEDCLCNCHVGYAGIKPEIIHLVPCCWNCQGCEKHINFLHVESHKDKCELYLLHMKYKDKYGTTFDKSFNKYLRRILKNKI